GSDVPDGHTGPNTSGNITYAITNGADIIVIQDPTESIENGYTLPEIIEAYETIILAATTANIPIIILNSQPRTGLELSQREALRDVAAAMVSTFGESLV